jgi:hypothetical protein
VNLEDITLSKTSQTQRDKYSITHLYVESKEAEVIEEETVIVSRHEKVGRQE